MYAHCSCRRRLVAGLLAGALVSTLLIAAPGRAHFRLDLNVRIIHVEHLADGLRLYLRTPMPLLVADRLGPTGADGLPEAAPYTSNRLEDGALVHYVDPQALSAEPEGLGRLAAAGFQLRSNDRELGADVAAVRAHPLGTQPPFATLDEARVAFEQAAVYPGDAEPAYVGDVVVDIILRYRTGAPVYAYSLSSSLNPGLAGQDETANLILDYGPGGARVFRARGLLAEPFLVARGAWSAVATFIAAGVRHILEGWDHVLFVICLTLGATRLSSLAWRATGFTVGHSVTLIGGFFGYAPAGSWFLPTVETGIALSIIYAAGMAVVHRSERRNEIEMLLITVAIGLLHGFGFSFFLHELLQIDSPDIWRSLLAFNIGVEIGQLALIVVAWPLFRLMARTNAHVWQFGRWGIAAACAIVAFHWTIQRASGVIAAI